MQDGRPLGDMWLEAKGKARVAGPDARSGRKGLFAHIQQQGNPYEDGRALDDAWLMHKGRKVMPRTDNNIPAMLAGKLPPEPRQQVDARKYETNLVADFTLTTKQ